MSRLPSTIPPRAGQPWTTSEDVQLLTLCDGRHAVEEIAEIHGRTVAGIRARIERHGLSLPPSAAKTQVKNEG